MVVFEVIGQLKQHFVRAFMIAAERNKWMSLSPKRGYWSSNCQTCALHDQCTPGKERRVRRWEHEAVVEAMERRLDRRPEAMRIDGHLPRRFENMDVLPPTRFYSAWPSFPSFV